MTHVHENLEIDRSSWPNGPLDGEPDKLNWTDEATGLPCMIVRNRLGALCGYAGVSEGHPYFGVRHNDLSDDVDVHGGLTYSDFCQGHICHVPEPGKPDRVFWFGFDCGHSHDLIPNLQYRFLRGHSEERYRDVAYVKAQCGRLAKQLAAVERI